MKRPLNLLCLLLALTLLGGCSVKIGGFDPAKEADKALQQVLEQLETLLDAGLLDREEYRERKRRIEEEMG